MKTRDWIKKLVRLFEFKPKDKEQLLQLLRNAEKEQLLGDDALSMIEGVLQVNKMRVRDVMIPRAQMVMIDKDCEPKALLETVISATHSRFPVTGENRDEVIGILLAKDLLKYSSNNIEDFEIEEILRPAIIVPENKHLDIMLKEFRANRNHMAVVVDEYGRATGFITIEDVLEQIVGDIEDEFDINAEDQIKQHSDNTYSIHALTSINDFNEYFKTNFPDAEFDTIGGLVINAFGHVPKRGETITIKNYAFEVIHADSRRVRLLKMST